MKHAGRIAGLAILICGAVTSASRAEVLAEYTYSNDGNFLPTTQGWTLADGTEEDVNFFNQPGTSLLMSISSGVPRPLITKAVATNAFFDAWTLTGNHRFAGNSQEEFGYFIFADDGTNLWHMSFYNHGSDGTDGIYMGGDPDGPVLGVTATKVWAEPVTSGFPAGSPENKPFDGFHDYSLVDLDGAGGAAPTVQLNGEDVALIAPVTASPSRFPAGTVGWGSLNPNEAGFMQTTHIVFDGNPNAEPPSNPGDFNGNLSVEGGDFLVWQANFGAADETSLNGNGDGVNGVGGGDFALWKANFGAASSPVATAAPEPQSLAMLVGGLLALSSRRRRR